MDTLAEGWEGFYVIEYRGYGLVLNVIGFNLEFNQYCNHAVTNVSERYYMIQSLGLHGVELKVLMSMVLWQFSHYNLNCKIVYC